MPNSRHCACSIAERFSPLHHSGASSVHFWPVFGRVVKGFETVDKIKSDYAKWGKVIKDANIKAD